MGLSMSRTWSPVSISETRFLRALSILLCEEASEICEKEKSEGKKVTVEDFLNRVDLYYRQTHDMLEAKFRSTWENVASETLTDVIKRFEEKKKEKTTREKDEEKQLKFDLSS
jgi:hypothetical protein